MLTPKRVAIFSASFLFHVRGLGVVVLDGLVDDRVIEAIRRAPISLPEAPVEGSTPLIFRVMSEGPLIAFRSRERRLIRDQVELLLEGLREIGSRERAPTRSLPILFASP